MIQRKKCATCATGCIDLPEHTVTQIDIDWDPKHKFPANLSGGVPGVVHSRDNCAACTATGVPVWLHIFL